MKKNTIEKGQILDINEQLIISDDYTVVYDEIPVGTLLGNLVWFPEYSINPAPSEIKKIVYLGDYKWGVRHLTSVHDEFDKLNIGQKESLLCHYLEYSKTYE